jgi:LPS export ABC transporter protein LptC
MKFLLAALVGLIAVSCSFKYQNWGVKDPNAIPQTVMTNFVEKGIQDGKVQYEFQGKKAETFEVLKEWRLKDVTFKEYDSKGVVDTRGTIAEATIKTDTHDATMKGAVDIWSSSQKAEIATSDLTWDQKAKTLQAAPTAVVSLKKDDGSTLTGTGLSLDFRGNELKLQGPVVGLWKTESSNENQSTNVSAETTSAQPPAQPPASLPASPPPALLPPHAPTSVGR